MDSVTTSFHTETQYETQLRPKEQNRYCEVIRKPFMHIYMHTGHFSSKLVGVEGSFRCYSLQTEKVPYTCTCSTDTKLFPKYKCVVQMPPFKEKQSN